MASRRGAACSGPSAARPGAGIGTTACCCLRRGSPRGRRPLRLCSSHASGPFQDLGICAKRWPARPPTLLTPATLRSAACLPACLPAAARLPRRSPHASSTSAREMAPRSAVLLALVATLSVGADAARLPVRLRARAASAARRECAPAPRRAAAKTAAPRCTLARRADASTPALPLPDAHVVYGHSARRVRCAARALPAAALVARIASPAPAMHLPLLCRCLQLSCASSPLTRAAPDLLLSWR
jgi:hypothetical protein